MPSVSDVAEVATPLKLAAGVKVTVPSLFSTTVPFVALRHTGNASACRFRHRCRCQQLRSPCRYRSVFSRAQRIRNRYRRVVDRCHVDCHQGAVAQVDAVSGDVAEVCHAVEVRGRGEGHRAIDCSAPRTVRPLGDAGNGQSVVFDIGVVAEQLRRPYRSRPCLRSRSAYPLRHRRIIDRRHAHRHLNRQSGLPPLSVATERIQGPVGIRIRGPVDIMCGINHIIAACRPCRCLSAGCQSPRCRATALTTKAIMVPSTSASLANQMDKGLGNLAVFVAQQRISKR